MSFINVTTFWLVLIAHRCFVTYRVHKIKLLPAYIPVPSIYSPVLSDHLQRKKCTLFQLPPSSYHKRFCITWQCVKCCFDKHFIFCTSVSNSPQFLPSPFRMYKAQNGVLGVLQGKAKIGNREQRLGCQTFCFRGLNPNLHLLVLIIGSYSIAFSVWSSEGQI